MAKFKSRIDYVCGNDFLRPVMQYIKFEDGFLYATEGHVIIRHHLSLHEFNDKEISIMNGKFIHKNVFVELYRYKELKVIEDGIVGIKNDVEALFEWKDCEGKYPDTDRILKEALDENNNTELDLISFNVKIFELLKKALVLDNVSNAVSFKFKGINKGILVTVAGTSINEQLAILMPVMR